MARRLLIALAVVVVLALVPQMRETMDFSAFYVVFLSTVLFWAAQATSWNILSGYSGYFSFGQGAFVGVAAYTTAVLAGRRGLSFWVAIPLSAVAAAVVALVIGWLAFRLRSLRGEIFALLTLAVPFILASVARLNPSIDGGQGVIVPIPDIPEWIGGFQDLAYLLNLAAAAIAVVIAIVMEHTRYGWALFAVRDAEDVAEGLGVPTFGHKMLAIAATGFVGGLAASVFAIQIGFVTVEAVFGLTIPLFVIVMSVLGGRSHWLGPPLGALVIVTLQDRLTSSGLESWSLIIFGTILVVLVLVARDGLVVRCRRRPRATSIAFAGTMLLLAASNVWGGLIDWLAVALVVAAVVALAPSWRRLTGARRTRAEPDILVPPAAPAPVPVALEHPQPSDDGAGAGGGDEPVIECIDVVKRFGGVVALRGVSLAVRPGELVGLVGPNGSGKTTLVGLMAGALRPTSGVVRVGGRDTAGMKPHHIAHLGVARTYQIPRPFDTMTVGDNVAMAIMFGREHRNLAAARREAVEHLELVGLTERAGRYPLEINLHERQLLEMARAVATRPRVLLLDEALAGLNPMEIDHAVEVVRSIHRTGITIVIVEHLLRVVNELATRVVVLDQGECLAQGDPVTVMREAAVIDAYLGKHAHA